MNISNSFKSAIYTYTKFNTRANYAVKSFLDFNIGYVMDSI